MKRTRGFSLVELLVVIGIVAVLISMLLPALNKARQQTKRIQCASNLKQCGVYLLMYAQDNKGWIVPVGDWGADASDASSYQSLGTNLLFTNGGQMLSNPTPWLTWPAVVFKMTKPIPSGTDFDRDPFDYAPD